MKFELGGKLIGSTTEEEYNKEIKLQNISNGLRKFSVTITSADGKTNREDIDIYIGKVSDNKGSITLTTNTISDPSNSNQVNVNYEGNQRIRNVSLYERSLLTNITKLTFI